MEYSSSPPAGGWCQEYWDHYRIDDCEDQVDRVETTGEIIWFVLTAWADEKEWCGTESGLGAYDPSIFSFADHVSQGGDPATCIIDCAWCRAECFTDYPNLHVSRHLGQQCRRGDLLADTHRGVVDPEHDRQFLIRGRGGNVQQRQYRPDAVLL